MKIAEFKKSGFEGEAIYKVNPYIVTSKGVVMISGTIESIKKELDTVGTYYDNCDIEVREYDLHLNDNTKIRKV